MLVIFYDVMLGVFSFVVVVVVLGVELMLFGVV